jgi:hypothetical protein
MADPWRCDKPGLSKSDEHAGPMAHAAIWVDWRADSSEIDNSELSGGRRPASARDYSPMTAQRKPIMMKKPVNRAIRPMPP